MLIWAAFTAAAGVPPISETSSTLTAETEAVEGVKSQAFALPLAAGLRYEVRVSSGAFEPTIQITNGRIQWMETGRDVVSAFVYGDAEPTQLLVASQDPAKVGDFQVSVFTADLSASDEAPPRSTVLEQGAWASWAYLDEDVPLRRDDRSWRTTVELKRGWRLYATATDTAGGHPVLALRHPTGPSAWLGKRRADGSLFLAVLAPEDGLYSLVLQATPGNADRRVDLRVEAIGPTRPEADPEADACTAMRWMAAHARLGWKALGGPGDPERFAFPGALRIEEIASLRKVVLAEGRGEECCDADYAAFAATARQCFPDWTFSDQDWYESDGERSRWSALEDGYGDPPGAVLRPFRDSMRTRIRLLQTVQAEDGAQRLELVYVPEKPLRE